MKSISCKQRAADENVYTRELNHRIANVLQHAISAVYFASRGDGQHLPAAIDRLSGAAELQQLLGARDDRLLDLPTYLLAVCRAVGRMMGADDTLSLVIDAKDLQVESSVARIVAMAIAEVVGNSIKHGLGDRRKGSIILSMRDDGTCTAIFVDDDGVGGGWTRPGGQGCSIVDGLISELGGVVRRARLETGYSRVAMLMASLAATGQTNSATE
jgi:two-component sensor histidine kinase